MKTPIVAFAIAVALSCAPEPDTSQTSSALSTGPTIRSPASGSSVTSPFSVTASSVAASWVRICAVPVANGTNTAPLDCRFNGGVLISDSLSPSGGNGTSGSPFTYTATATLANGHYVLEVDGYNGGSSVGDAQEPITVGAPCISITSPTNGATLAAGSTTPIATKDTCSGAWFESLYVDGAHVADFSTGSVVLNAATLASGQHTVKVTSQSVNPNSVELGAASVQVTVAPPSCIAITSPVSGASVVQTSSTPIATTDTCSGVWFESLYVDNAHVADFPAGSVVLNATSLSAGAHLVEVTSQSVNPGSVQLGFASIQLTVTASTCVPTTCAAQGKNCGSLPDGCGGTLACGTCTAPQTCGGGGTANVCGAAGSTGSAQDAVTLPPGAALPTEAQCAAWVAQQGSDPENAPQNTGSLDGFDYNKPPPGGTPTYYYSYAQGPFSSNVHLLQVDGNQSGTTDDLVRIFSCKYGIWSNITRSQMVNETHWNQECEALSIPGVKTAVGTHCGCGGDLNNPAGNPSGLPVTAITPGGVFSALDGAGGLSGSNHYDSWGIEQDKVYYSWMYWPMIALSTSWALDVRAAELRSCIDGYQATYFSSNGSNVSDYDQSVANARSNPNGPVPAGMACLQVNWNGVAQTNINCLTIGCFGSHLSGGWFADSSELSYDSNGFANIAQRSWPGGETN